jgi:hypothetical protein
MPGDAEAIYKRMRQQWLKLKARSDEVGCAERAVGHLGTLALFAAAHADRQNSAWLLGHSWPFLAGAHLFTGACLSLWILPYPALPCVESRALYRDSL